MKRLVRCLVACAVVVLGLSVLAGIYLAEGTLHLRRRPVTSDDQLAARTIAASEGGEVETVSIRAADGAALSAWYFRSHKSNGKVVLVLHGQGDNRAGSLSFDRLLLHHCFNVLAPDSRGHGESGGIICTYGIKEIEDVRSWLDWLQDSKHPTCIYGLGESMGAAILLQSLNIEHRFCGVVAESSFSSFQDIAYYRLGHQLGGGEWLGRFLLRPVVESGLLYGRLRYHLDLAQAAPEKAVAHTATRIFLIHGSADDSIPLSNPERILKAAGGKTSLWEVKGARHTGALSTAPDEFEKQVLDFFE